MRFVKCHEPFSTADAESVEAHFVDGSLEVGFTDWRERRVRLAFPDAVAFRWDPLAGEGAPRDDESYEVIDSPWIEMLIAANQIGSAEGYRHFKLCFNAASVLDVIARGIQLLTEGYT